MVGNVSERKRSYIAITRGMAGAAMRGRTVSRRCGKCGLGMPPYPGRYPKTCPTCGGEVEVVESTEPVITCVSMVPRIQRLIDAGASAPPRGPRASSTFVVRYDEMNCLVPGGKERLISFMEGPVRGRFFRVERTDAPVIILELDDALQRANLFAADDPSVYLGFDPRREFVDTAPMMEAYTNLRLLRGYLDDLYAEAVALRPGAKSILKPLYIRAIRADERQVGEAVTAFLRAVAKHAPNADDGRFEILDILDQMGIPFYESRLDERGGPWGAVNTTPSWDHSATIPRATVEGERRCAVGRPRKSGEGQTSPYGGFRIHVGRATERKPRKDMQRALQNKRNARRGLAKRVKAAKEWHRSPEGARLHRALARYNERPGGAGGVQRRKAQKRRTVVYSESLAEAWDRRKIERALTDIARRFGVGGTDPVEWHPGGAVSVGWQGPPSTEAAALRAAKAALPKGSSIVVVPEEESWWVLIAEPPLPPRPGKVTADPGKVDAINARWLDQVAARHGVIKRHKSPIGRRGSGKETLIYEFPTWRNAEEFAREVIWTHVMADVHEGGLGSGRPAVTVNQVAADTVEAHLARWRPTKNLIEATAAYAETIDDVLDAVLRKLLVIEALDILQDVEFDEESGSIYLFFDPSLSRDEITEVVSMLQHEFKDIALIASPDQSLPQEAAPADWWVVYLPRAHEGMPAPPPDPRVYSTHPEAPGPQMRQSIVVPAPVTANSPEAVADGIDVDGLLGGLGGGVAESVAHLPRRVQARLAKKMALANGARPLRRT